MVETKLMFRAKVRANKKEGVSKILTIPHKFCQITGIERGDYVKLQLVEIIKEGEEHELYRN